MEVWQHLLSEKSLDGRMKLINQHLLLDNHIFAKNLLQRHQHNVIRVYEDLAHLVEQ